MTTRITKQFVEAQLSRLNSLAGTPADPCDPNATGVRWQVGNYHLQPGYNGFSIVRVASHNGAVADVSCFGYRSLREVSQFLTAYILGFTEGYLNCSKRATPSDRPVAAPSTHPSHRTHRVRKV